MGGNFDFCEPSGAHGVMELVQAIKDGMARILTPFWHLKLRKSQFNLVGLFTQLSVVNTRPSFRDLN